MRSRSQGAVILLALVSSGCSSQWLPGYFVNNVAHTDVIVRTVPPGATVFVNHVKQQDVSPIRIPVDYEHTETQYERQSNYGTRMRADMSPLVTVLTFPVWGVASFFHYRESLRRHEYGGNRLLLSAMLSEHDEAEETITLEGEKERQVLLKLAPTR